MLRGNALKHTAALALIFFVAFLINSASFFLSGISPAYNQGSDTTVHLVHWREFSRGYSGNFDHDTMFQNFQEAPTGVLFVDKTLVRIGEFLRIPLLDWSIVVSACTLLVFLGGVYVLALYSTGSVLLAVIVSLVSTIPVISLGLSSWGMLVLGFVPKEIAVAISVWLTLLYLSGVVSNSPRRIALFFFVLGVFANFYLTLFFHYALLLLTVEVLRARSIRKEHLLYGALFMAAAPLALFDIFVRAGHFTPPNLAIIIDHYGTTLHSARYLFLHYLRKQVIYGVLVGVLWYVYRRVLKKEYSPLMRVWYTLWWSTLCWSLVGVGIEVFAPLYMKYMLSRISVWFYCASMIIVAYTAYEIYGDRFARSVRNRILFSLLLLFVLLSQTSLLNVYIGIRDSVSEAADYRAYLSVTAKLNAIVPPKSLVLANPDRWANTLRTYGGVGVYVAAKDGNVILFDGRAAGAWFERYTETRRVFAQKDFFAIQDFAAAHDLRFYFFNTKDIKKSREALRNATILESGDYGLADLNQANF